MNDRRTRKYRFDKDSVSANGTRLTARAVSDKGSPVKVVVYTNPELTEPDTFTFHADGACHYGVLMGAMTPDERAELVLNVALKKPVELLVEDAVLIDLSLPGPDCSPEPLRKLAEEAVEAT